ncbi:hypothetical protein [Streptomyces mirabilis]|uniref:hypothetical protein n=1 Tax=Streptomyces mirabilis TaxID=68239 RepID=UPI0036C516BC
MSFVIYVLGLGIFAQGTSQLMLSGVPRRSDRLPARLRRIAAHVVAALVPNFEFPLS